MKKQINKQKVYKVVNINKSGRMYSASVPQTAAHCLEYKLGQWVKPKLDNSKIFVFKSLYAAQRFACGESQVIFECEYTGKATQPTHMCYDYEYMRKVSQFWSAYVTGTDFVDSNISNTNTLPTGTLYVDEIRLVRKVGVGD